MSKQYYAVQRTGEKQNELTHWKYIKRERGKNGKWRYYYDKESLKRDIKDKLGYDERDDVEEKARKVDHARETVKVMTDNFNTLPRNDGSIYGGKTKDEWYDEKISAEKELKRIGQEYRDTLKEYYKTPLGQLDLFMDEINSAKTWLKKKLGIN